jgi:acetyltransferase-like isoleucine patch superfamily enzyme
MDGMGAWRLASDARRWWRYGRRLRRGYRLRDRAAIHYRLARRRAFARFPLHGNPARLLAEGRLEVGPDVLLASDVLLNGEERGRIEIGAGTFVGIGTQIGATDLVHIGAHCQIAAGCFITDYDHCFDELDTTLLAQGLTSRGPTRIGDHVWLGAHAVVTSGVTIGDRCVIGANSVVTEDVPPYCVAVGAPARVVRRLGDERPDGPPAQSSSRGSSRPATAASTAAGENGSRTSRARSA